MFEAYKSNPAIFNKVLRGSGQLSEKWHQSYQKKILSDKDIQAYLENDKVGELEGKITDRFRELIDKDLPKLIECIDKEIKKK